MKVTARTLPADVGQHTDRDKRCVSPQAGRRQSLCESEFKVPSPSLALPMLANTPTGMNMGFSSSVCPHRCVCLNSKSALLPSPCRSWPTQRRRQARRFSSSSDELRHGRLRHLRVSLRSAIILPCVSEFKGQAPTLPCRCRSVFSVSRPLLAFLSPFLPLSF